MGLIWEIFKALGEGETPQEREKRIERELFEEEADALGMDEWEKEDCKQSGMTPEEWAEENDSDYEN